MNRHISMSFFKTVVLSYVMEIISADHDGFLHLHFLYHSGKDATTDGHISSEGAFFVDVGAFDGLLLIEK